MFSMSEVFSKFDFFVYLYVDNEFGKMRISE